MAVYKVPQDVEADDKLLGPFTFRQFIYLIVVAMAIGIGYVLSQIFIGLAVIVLPIVIFFGVLALPLKKDQPMEAYIGALISFHFLKPRKRLWQPDGLDALVEITAPKSEEESRTKDLSQEEARARLSYLTDIVESDGWAVRGLGVSQQGVVDYAEEPVQQSLRPIDDVDVLDEQSSNAQRFDQMLDSRDERDLSSLRSNFQQQMSAPPPATVPQLHHDPYPPIQQPSPQTYNTPSAATVPITPQPEQTTSINNPSPDIIRLANESDDISIASVADQAHRLEKQRGLPEEEVEISLH